MERFVFETALGHVALARQTAAGGRCVKLYALSFGHPSQRAALLGLTRTLARGAHTIDSSSTAARADCVYPGCDELVDRLCAFARGEADSFLDLQIDASHLTPFGRAVITACRQIPWGETRTYGELARQAGRPGAARAVGSVMAGNRVPLIVPCHRVVPASGGLGGFSAPQGVAMKQRLLDTEQRAAALLSR